MELSIQKLSKAFNQKSVFRDLTFTVRSGSRFAIRGHNGSGKSTLLKILSGATLPSSGEIHYRLRDHQITGDQVYRYVHFVAPYNTVIEELNVEELFLMHKKLGLLKGYPHVKDWLDHLEYGFQMDKPIKTFSSRMKQRIKLGLALLDDRPLLLLDEPCSNLDAAGKQWFFNTAAAIEPWQTIIIASNEAAEIDFCVDSIRVGTL